MLPVELQVFYYLRTEGVQKLQASLLTFSSPKKQEVSPRPESEAQPIVTEIAVEDFKNPVPLIVSDRVKGVRTETRALLFLDDQLRGEDAISPQKPRYRLSYVPLPEDLGTHNLSVRLADSSEPLATVSLSIVGRASEIGESLAKIG